MISKNKLEFWGLFIIFGISLIWSGGYYEYISVILGAFLAVYINVFCRKRIIIRNYNLIAVTLFITLMYWISCIYATDVGMAMIGAAKKSVVFLFAVALNAVNCEHRKQFLFYLPEITGLLTLLSYICSFIPLLHGCIIKAGRFCGTFGYANTYALFLLVALLILLYTFKQRKLIFNIFILIVLLTGMWFTGSRYTWILTFICLFIFAGYKKALRKWIYLLLFILAFVTICAGIFFKQSEAMGRFFSTNLSTLYGRLLYWQDALKLIVKHPFGMGYMGYYYNQMEIQTGVYTVRYVHNDLLQIILDIGIIPAAIVIFSLSLILYNKTRTFIEKLLIFAIIVHSFMEFDFEHTGVIFLLLLIISCSEDKQSQKNWFINKLNWLLLNKNKLTCRAYIILNLLGCICVYFAFPLCLYALNNTEMAAAFYPIYTEAQLVELSLETDYNQANVLADKILTQNKTSFLAYNAKAQISLYDNDIINMVQYKKKAISINKFDYNEYADYIVMLNNALEYSIQNNDAELTVQIIYYMNELLSIIDENKNTVSYLGGKIDDNVQIDLPEDVVNEIQELADLNLRKMKN